MNESTKIVLTAMLWMAGTFGALALVMPWAVLGWLRYADWVNTIVLGI